MKPINLESISQNKHPLKMKTLSTLRTQNKFQTRAAHTMSSFLGLLLFAGFIFTGCDQEIIDAPVAPSQKITAAYEQNATAELNVINLYPSLSSTTTWELQQARAATARYRDISNAIKDQYVDIKVVTENMGYHYMKVSEVDETFDLRKPEILIYNKNQQGKFELVAIEYAIPLTLSESAPEGFSGTDDVWDENHGFGLWLLHVWVWSYNPDGVFNPTNPLIHLH
jgi:hypothetical protein